MRSRAFKKRLAQGHDWLLAVLISGNLVIGVHILDSVTKYDLNVLPTFFTFLTSLMLALFFVQMEYTIKNRKIKDANARLIQETRKIEEEKERQAEMISNISDVITILDENSIIRYVSPNVEKIFGWKSEELTGQYGFDLIHPDYRDTNLEKFRELMEKFGKIDKFETIAKCRDGEYRDIHITIKNMLDNPLINGLLMNYHDISEQKRLEAEKAEMEAHVRNQQSLESIGTFAAGLAHEINNPINGIMNYAQLINDMQDSNEETIEYTGEIIHETERVADLVKDLLRFARRDDNEFDIAEPREIINGTLTLIRTIMKHDQIDLIDSIEPDLPLVRCKSQQIQQVLMNMLTNARDALNKKYPGYDDNKVCIVTCKKITRDREDWLRIMVEDHGCGIREELRSKLFNPFFTTKPRDKGTGLGMSISYRIAHEHNGILDFESVENEYTKFYLDLPLF